MTVFVFVNNVDTTLANPITAAATTLTLTDASNLPASIPGGEALALTLNDAATRDVYEIVYATAVSGATLTVTRGQEGTTAVAWNAGDFAFSGPTAGQMESLVTPPSGVSSFNTRTGAVLPQTGDYDWSQITGTFPYVTSFKTRTGAVVPVGSDYTPAMIGAEPALGNPSVSGYVLASTTAGVRSWVAQSGGGGGGGVTSWNGRTGAVVPDAADINGALGYTAADDSKVVHIAGTETVTGTKTFSALLTASGGISSTSGTFSGSITCSSMNATSSDARMKSNIRRAIPRPLHREIPYVSFRRRLDKSHGRGAIAQSVLQFEPCYVTTFLSNGRERYAIDLQSMAYEQATWSGQEVDRLTKRVLELEAKLDKLVARLNQ